MRTLIGSVLGLLFLLVVLGAVERVLPSVPRHRRRWRTDLAWWFATTLSKPLIRLSVAVVVLPYALVLGLPLDDTLVYGHGPLAQLPWWVQLVAVVVLDDAIGYGMHRLRHQAPLWRLHAVHHSADPLDWLSAVRVHPLDTLATRAPAAVVLVILGFDLRAIAALAPILGLYGLLLHANVRWPVGPLRGLVATPAFHRWHHATRGAPEGGCNFAGLLPVFDRLFGTYHLPDADPEVFGLHGEPLPESFRAQLALRGPGRSPGA